MKNFEIGTTVNGDITLYCTYCHAPVAEYAGHLDYPLLSIVTDADVHEAGHAVAHAADLHAPRYGVFETDGGFQVRDRVEGRNIGPVFRAEKDAWLSADGKNNPKHHEDDAIDFGL